MSTALLRGLEVLRLVAGESEPLGFNEINRRLGVISRASLTRLLKTLVADGYLIKRGDSGRYECGDKMAAFACVRTPGRREALIARLRPLMARISRRYEVTVILMERVKNILLNIHRENTEFSYTMQRVGTINDIPEEPWLTTVAAFEGAESVVGGADVLKDEGLLREIRGKGYHFEDETRRENVRRLAFPLFGADGGVVGILGLGGTLTQLDDANVASCVEEIMGELRAARF